MLFSVNPNSPSITDSPGSDTDTFPAMSAITPLSLMISQPKPSVSSTTGLFVGPNCSCPLSTATRVMLSPARLVACSKLKSPPRRCPRRSIYASLPLTFRYGPAGNSTSYSKSPTAMSYETSSLRVLMAMV